MVSPPPCTPSVSFVVSSLGNVSYRYDNSGNLTYQRDELSERRTYFDYDFKGNFIGHKVFINSYVNSEQSFLFSNKNIYDDKNRVTRKDMQGEHYALDAYYYYDDETDLISSVATTIGGSRRINYTYDDEDRVVTKSMTTTTPYVNSYTYNDDGLIATDTVTAKNGTFVYTYTYDDNGNITEITKNGTVQQRYIYDETDQLVREDNRDINKTVVYTYDGYGNILNKKEYAFTTGDLGAVTDTITYTYNDTGWKDQLTSYDGQSITYDAIGNPTSYRGITMTWNGRKLMSYTKGDDVITYKYDGNGLRTSKTVNGVKHDYYYDENNQLIYEIKEGVYELYYKYDADGNLFSITRYRYSDGAKHVYYAVTNTRGDVLELRSASGAIYATYTYDSWGKCISVKNSSGAACSVNTVAVQNSIRYRGYVYDYETGLYYLQSRYYDPEVGRFLNADDAEYIGYSGEQLSYNMFAYCENNAVNDSDVYGNFPWKEITETFEKIFDYIDETCDFLLEKYGLSNKKYKKLTKYKSPSSILKYVNKNKKKIKYFKNNISSIANFLNIVLTVAALSNILKKDQNIVLIVAEIFFYGLVRLVGMACNFLIEFFVTRILQPLIIMKYAVKKILTYALDTFLGSDYVVRIKDNYLKYVSVKKISFKDYMLSLFKALCSTKVFS